MAKEETGDATLAAATGTPESKVHVMPVADVTKDQVADDIASATGIVEETAVETLPVVTTPVDTAVVDTTGVDSTVVDNVVAETVAVKNTADSTVAENTVVENTVVENTLVDDTLVARAADNASAGAGDRTMGSTTQATSGTPGSGGLVSNLLGGLLGNGGLLGGLL